MKTLKILVSLVFVMLLTFPAHGRFETHDFTSPQMEKDYAQLVQELRCLVCQNQNLADSNAELAQDMRIRVYKMLSEGSSKEEIVDFMVQRYGDFVMYRPPVKSTTYLLWFGPLIFFAVAALVVVPYIRRQKTVAEVVNEQQQKKAHSLLDEE